MKKLIGITGLQGSGKDTVGDMLCNEYKDFEKDSFASVLKDATAILFGWDRKMLAGQTPEDRVKREEIDPFWSAELGTDWTPRKALQILGTELFRTHLHKDFWVSALKRKLLSSKKNVVICDCRFPNEIDMIRSLGGMIIRVERGQLPLWYRKAEQVGQRILNKDPDLLYPEVEYGKIEELGHVHQSEYKWLGYDNPDIILENNGTIRDLAIQLQQKLPTDK